MGEHSSDRSPHAPPPRPELQHFSPAPLHDEPTPSGAVKASRSLWLTSFGVGALAVFLVFLSRNAQLEHVGAMVREVDATVDSSRASFLASLAFYGSLGLLILVIVLEALLLRTMLRRRRWSRLSLLMVLPAHAIVAIVAEAFLTGPGGEGAMIGSFALAAEGAQVRWLLAIQLSLASLAALTSFGPGARAWFTTPQEHRSGGSAVRRQLDS